MDDEISLIPERVRCGIVMLDRKDPNWRERVPLVDWSDLNLCYPDCCVLSKLFGDFETGITLLNISIGTYGAYGFNGMYFTPYDVALVAEWKKQLGVA
jgi:hypothetical protein